MFKLFVLLPLAILILAWFFGTKPSYRWGLTALALWWWVTPLLASSFIPVERGLGDLFVIMLTILMIVTGPLVAILVGVGMGTKSDPSPAERTYEAYENLEPEQKERVRKGAQAAAKFACEQASKHFRRNGKKFYADTFGAAKKLL